MYARTSPILPTPCPASTSPIPGSQSAAAVCLPKRYLDGLYDLEVFIGGPGGEFPYLHYDYLGLFAYINMVVGSKEFTIYPPDQEPLLYVNPEVPWISTVENHHQPDLAKYPLLAQTRPIKVVLTAGETLFIPSGWWHTARSLTPSISVAFDQLCSSNWRFFTRDCCRASAWTPAPGSDKGGLGDCRRFVKAGKELLLGKR